jgi:hypothetical protein
MTKEQFIRMVLDNFTQEITDRVFLSIEEDPNLLNEYLDQISACTRKEINAALGKAIKLHFNLQNDGINNTPKSFLIKTLYTKHS